MKPPAQLRNLPNNSTDIYQPGAIERYADRPIELENLCLADFVALFNYVGKNAKKNNEDPLDEDEVQNVENDLFDSDANVEVTEYVLEKEYKLQNGGTLKLRRKPKVLRFFRYNMHQHTRHFFRERVQLFYPWRNELSDVELADCEAICRNHSDIINTNSRKYIKLEEDINELIAEVEKHRREEEAVQVEPDEEINVFNYDENEINADLGVDLNVNPQPVNAADPTNAPSELPNKRYNLPDQLVYEEYLALLDSLNVKQRDYLMHLMHKFKTNQLPIYDFISGGAGVGKSQLIKAIYQSLLRILRSNSGPVDDTPEVVLVAYTGKAAHNIGGITAHGAFGLTIGQSLNDFKNLTADSLNTFRTKLRSCKAIIIDEISMLGQRTFDQINQRLCQVIV